MLTAAPNGPFFTLKVETFGLTATLSGARLVTWKPGQSLIGITVRGRYVTDGTEGVSFAGCPWVRKWDRREGYILLRVSRLRFTCFTQPEIPLIFVGSHISMSQSGGISAPALVAVPKAMLVENVDATLRQEWSGQADGDEKEGWISAVRAPALHAIHKGVPISIRLGSGGTTCRIRPRRALTRAEWDLLGFHIPTRSESARKGVIGIVDHSTNFGLALPFALTEEMTEGGFRGVPTQLYRNGSGDQLVVKEAFVVDPAKAALAMPFLANAVPGTVLRALDSLSDNSVGRIRMTLVQSTKLPKLPKIFKYGIHNGVPCIEIAAPDIRVSPETELLTESMDLGLVACIEASRLDSVLVSARKLAATRVIPPAAKSYTAFSDGVQLAGRYFLLADADAFELVKTKRASAKSREEFLLSKFQRPLPKNWEALTDAEIAECFAWDDRRAEGWLTRKALCERFSGLTWGDQTLSLERISAPSRELLYKPITLEEVFLKPEFHNVATTYLGEHAAFFMRCLMNENARCALAAGAFTP